MNESAANPNPQAVHVWTEGSSLSQSFHKIQIHPQNSTSLKGRAPILLSIKEQKNKSEKNRKTKVKYSKGRGASRDGGIQGRERKDKG